MRHRLIRQYGDFSVAYSVAVQPRLEYFGDERGFIAFRRRWGISFVLGDVVASSEHTESMIDAFLKSQKRVVFCQASEQTTKRLVERGIELVCSARLSHRRSEF